MAALVVADSILGNFEAAKSCSTVDEFWQRLSLGWEQPPEPGETTDRSVTSG